MATSITGLLGIVVGAGITYFFQKRFDLHYRRIDRRQDAYTEVNEILAGIFDGASQEMKDKAIKELPKQFRNLQIWASDEVVVCFTEFMHKIEKKSATKQSDIDSAYKTLVISLRKDLLGKTKLNLDNIYPVNSVYIV